MPIRIDCDKQCIAPREGVIVSQQPDTGYRLGIAGVKVIGRRQGEESRTGPPCKDCDVVKMRTEEGPTRLLVIAIDEKQRRRVCHVSQKTTLVQVDTIDDALVESIPVAVEEVRHLQRDIEIIAEREVQIRLIARHLLHCSDIEVGMKHASSHAGSDDCIGVGVALHAKTECAVS